MIIATAFAAAALAQWTGPRTVEYMGPGVYCGGGYAIRLGPGERALVLPQGHAPQSTRLVLSRGEVNVWTGVHTEPGRIVQHYGGSAVVEQGDGNGFAYLISDETPYGLRITSSAFHGYKHDRWFFTKANFASDADHTSNCLATYSH